MTFLIIFENYLLLNNFENDFSHHMLTPSVASSPGGPSSLPLRYYKGAAILLSMLSERTSMSSRKTSRNLLTFVQGQQFSIAQGWWVLLLTGGISLMCSSCPPLALLWCPGVPFGSPPFLVAIAWSPNYPVLILTEHGSKFVWKILQ